jgi:cytosine/adenosine deaminase-related metal-dependent hydrolase
MQAAGIRAFVGKLSMDISSRPTYVESSAESALSSANSFVERCHQIVSNLAPTRRLVEPVLTPRFVPTCSNELLDGLGKLSAAKSLRIQSHMAEAHDQVAWVRRERGSEDIEVFEHVSISVVDHLLILTQFEPESPVDTTDDTSSLHVLNFSSVVSRSVAWHGDSALSTLKRVLLSRTVSSS